MQGTPMMAAGGLVFALNTLLSLAIGIRLLRSRDGEARGPERWLAIYFLVGAVVAHATSGAAYAGWGDPSLGISLAATAWLNGISMLCSSLGIAALYAFTGRTFHDNDRRMPRVIGLATGALLAAWAAGGLVEGFAIRIFPGPLYWCSFALRIGAFGWMAWESLRYYAVLRRRLRFGLAEPLVANRFLLWGVWSIAAALLLATDPIVRTVYVLATGDAAESAESVALVAAPMIAVTVAITGVLGAGAAAILFLTFFPTVAYRRRIERSATLAPKT